MAPLLYPSVWLAVHSVMNYTIRSMTNEMYHLHRMCSSSSSSSSSNSSNSSSSSNNNNNSSGNLLASCRAAHR